MTNEITPAVSNEIVIQKTYGTYYEQLKAMELTNKEAVFDLETKKGLKEATSYIFSLRKSKKPVADAHKEAKADAKVLCDALDAGKREIVGRIDAMIDQHDAPIKEAKEKEANRITGIERRIEIMKSACNLVYQNPAHYDSAGTQSLIKEVEAIIIDDSFEEFKADAALAKEETLQSLRSTIEGLIKTEKEAAELEQLRKDKEEQDRKLREAEIARQAEENARAKVEAELTAAKKSEREAKEAASQQAYQDRLIREEAAKKAERDKQAAVQAERQRAERVQQEGKRQAEESRRLEQIRIENVQHQGKVQAEINNAFMGIGLNSEQSMFICEHIFKGAIPHLKIEY